MFDQVLVGSAASICNVTIHALVMLVVIRVANAMQKKSAIAISANCRYHDRHGFGLDGCAYFGSTGMGDRLFFC